MLVKPAGFRKIMFALNYAPLNSGLVENFVDTVDAAQPCIRAAATKLKIPCRRESLLASGLFLETCFRRTVVPRKQTHGLPPYAGLGGAEGRLHHEFRSALCK